MTCYKVEQWFGVWCGQAIFADTEKIYGHLNFFQILVEETLKKKSPILCSKEIQKWKSVHFLFYLNTLKWLCPLNSSAFSLSSRLLSCSSIHTAEQRWPERELPGQTLQWRQCHPVPTAPDAYDEGTTPPSPQVTLWVSAGLVHCIENDQPDENQVNLPWYLPTHTILLIPLFGTKSWKKHIICQLKKLFHTPNI